MATVPLASRWLTRAPAPERPRRSRAWGADAAASWLLLLPGSRGRRAADRLEVGGAPVGLEVEGVALKVVGELLRPVEPALHLLGLDLPRRDLVRHARARERLGARGAGLRGLRGGRGVGHRLAVLERQVDHQLLGRLLVVAGLGVDRAQLAVEDLVLGLAADAVPQHLDGLVEAAQVREARAERRDRVHVVGADLERLAPQRLRGLGISAVLEGEGRVEGEVGIARLEPRRGGVRRAGELE